mmetsp:Transcript_4463/g.11594  ORF Transcript_4463/g.11594 Transcript_4463/m.11594 type:complete len:468 (-) Transcript_4463:429-1832(-)
MPSSTTCGGTTQRSRQLTRTRAPWDPMSVSLRLILLRLRHRGTASAMYTAPSSPTPVHARSRSRSASQCGSAPAKYRAPVSPMALCDRFRDSSATGRPHASFHAPSAEKPLPRRSSCSRRVQAGSASATATPASLPHCVCPNRSTRKCGQRGSALASRAIPSLPSALCDRSSSCSPSHVGRTFARRPAPSGPKPASARSSRLRLTGSPGKRMLAPSSPRKLLLSTKVSRQTHSLSTSASSLAPSARMALLERSRCLSFWQHGNDAATRPKPSDVAARLSRVSDDMSGRAAASCWNHATVPRKLLLRLRDWRRVQRERAHAKSSVLELARKAERLRFRSVRAERRGRQRESWTMPASPMRQLSRLRVERRGSLVRELHSAVTALGGSRFPSRSTVVSAGRFGIPSRHRSRTADAGAFAFRRARVPSPPQPPWPEHESITSFITLVPKLSLGPSSIMWAANSTTMLLPT